ncbi:acetyl-CoA carboxylase biotin carboxylase subunit [Abyssisolibacter fermentans]|uniref:acetyl-CoA carboxylase biotin carboxylase subunit n=1 Tax=Abyssisolibacter fermentans TaxID=1766203 RepID=UPI00082A5C62|nr:acetyl-CoA carboxylase biotin carboxylase subunit [Abyssisolibacter fermentans]
MFSKILIANRGEIAVRIIRACKEMGIQTVAIYSEADKEALHVQLADEAYCIGPAPANKSYLDMKNILSTSVLTNADAIHPGFGFLSENSTFAKMCEECNISFIGPKANMIAKMGNKACARDIMKKMSVPVVPGSDGTVDDIKEAVYIANEIGYPVMIKASAGGGGRGMRVAYSTDELRRMYNTAKSEALASFGDDSMYLEKFIENPRHIEFQILADKYGNVIHLGERDCTVQRRNQKVLEESPSQVITQELRKQMGKAAVLASKAVDYENAGTVEFLLDKYGKYYFIEMNTRIQVEHPVTEFVTGIDLVKEQIKIAYGLELSYKQENIKISGHSIECRINAENPEKGFMPSPGTIEALNLPGGNGVRIDSSIYQGYTIPSAYDSMLAKLIVHAEDRESAILKMKRALDEFIIKGVSTNIDFQYKILDNELFKNGSYDTSFINDCVLK